jgi:hypothetical protein
MAALEMLTAWSRNYLDADFWNGFRAKSKLDASGCRIWQKGRNRKGYGQVRRDGKQQLAHRVALALVNGEIPDGLCVLHHCDVPACINTDHLFLGTNADNNRDMAQKGRGSQPKGEANGKSKLTAADIPYIRANPERRRR